MARMPDAMQSPNRRHLDRFYTALNARDPDAVMACYGPGATIEVYQDGPFAGKHPAARELLVALFDTFRELRFTLHDVIEDGDRIAAEVSSIGAFADGTPYANHYHNRFDFSDGAIVFFREYPTGYRGDAGSAS